MRCVRFTTYTRNIRYTHIIEVQKYTCEITTNTNSTTNFTHKPLHRGNTKQRFLTLVFRKTTYASVSIAKVCHMLDLSSRKQLLRLCEPRTSPKLTGHACLTLYTIPSVYCSHSRTYSKGRRNCLYEYVPPRHGGQLIYSGPIRGVCAYNGTYMYHAHAKHCVAN